MTRRLNDWEVLVQIDDGELFVVREVGDDWQRNEVEFTDEK